MDLSTTAGIIPRCRHCGHDLTLKLINLGLPRRISCVLTTLTFHRVRSRYQRDSDGCSVSWSDRRSHGIIEDCQLEH